MEPSSICESPVVRSAVSKFFAYLTDYVINNSKSYQKGLKIVAYLAGFEKQFLECSMPLEKVMSLTETALKTTNLLEIGNRALMQYIMPLVDKGILGWEISKYFTPDSYCSVQCHICQTPTQKVCGNCQIYPYCGESCQKKDWLTHKEICK